MQYVVTWDSSPTSIYLGVNSTELNSEQTFWAGGLFFAESQAGLHIHAGNVTGLFLITIFSDRILNTTPQQKFTLTKWRETMETQKAWLHVRDTGRAWSAHAHQNATHWGLNDLWHLTCHFKSSVLLSILTGKKGRNQNCSDWFEMVEKGLSHLVCSSTNCRGECSPNSCLLI